MLKISGQGFQLWPSEKPGESSPHKAKIKMHKTDKNNRFHTVEIDQRHKTI